MDKFKYNKIKLVCAAICMIIGVIQIILIIFDKDAFGDSGWIVNVLFWVSACAFFTIKYLKAIREYKEYRKEIEEQEALLSKVKFKKKTTKK